MTGEGNGNPLQYSCLEKPMDGGACSARVHGVTKSWTQLNDFSFFLLLVMANRGYSSLRFSGFSLQSFLLLQSMGSRPSSFSSLGLCSCGIQVLLLHSTWNLPGPEIKPMSLALQGRFLTTGAPGTLNFFKKPPFELMTG